RLVRWLALFFRSILFLFPYVLFSASPKVVRKYTSFEELTPTLLREFVEKIVIHESEALDGKRRGKLRRQEIEIYYSFVGKVELPD
ncbi:DUF4368 domain-containing protein, partial [Oscillospiraceae bacterium 50-16]